MILSHRAPSSFNMSSYRAKWTHFKPNFIFFGRTNLRYWPKMSDPEKSKLFPKCKSPHLAPKTNALSIRPRGQCSVISRREHLAWNACAEFGVSLCVALFGPPTTYGHKDTFHILPFAIRQHAKCQLWGSNPRAVACSGS